MPEPEYCNLCDVVSTEEVDEASARIKVGDLVRQHQHGGHVHERCYAARAAQIIHVRDFPGQPQSVRRAYAKKLADLPTYYTEPFTI